MADQENELFAIEVDADDYAESAATDAPSVPRTYQSEADFQKQKASYSAKNNYGSTYKDLLTAVPVLHDGMSANHTNQGHTEHDARVKLSKKDVQLLGYAAGEMYFDKDFGSILELCERVRKKCVYDDRTAESLERWTRQCSARLREREVS